VNPAIPDARSVHRRRKLRWRQAKKEVTATDKKKEVTSLHALVEPADLTLVDGAKRRPGRSVILT
jgi:hypothetical protein